MGKSVSCCVDNLRRKQRTLAGGLDARHDCCVVVMVLGSLVAW